MSFVVYSKQSSKIGPIHGYLHQDARSLRRFKTYDREIALFGVVDPRYTCLPLTYEGIVRDAVA